MQPMLLVTLTESLDELIRGNRQVLAAESASAREARSAVATLVLV